MILRRAISDIFDTHPYRLGLALSGGGAKGFAHLGTILALQKFGLKPDIYAGVSAGSIVATLIASGLTPMDVVECFGKYEGFKNFTAITLPKHGFFKLDKFAKIFDSWLPVKYLEELSVPAVVCATDIQRGKSVGWITGEITPRVIASCSMPIVFTPAEIDGTMYVDGGVLRNLPSWAIREHCHTLIGSNCSPLSPGYFKKDSIAALAWRSYELMSKANTIRDTLLCDLVIRHTKISSIPTFDMKGMKQSVIYGYDISCCLLEKYLTEHNL